MQFFEKKMIHHVIDRYVFFFCEGFCVDPPNLSIKMIKCDNSKNMYMNIVKAALDKYNTYLF